MASHLLKRNSLLLRHIVPFCPVFHGVVGPAQTGGELEGQVLAHGGVLDREQWGYVNV